MSLPVGIDTLKSTIGKRGGLARANRFAIYITHPNMKSPMGPGLFNADIGGLVSNVAGSLMSGGSIDPMSFINDPRDMFLLCESVQLPGKRIATMESFITHKAIKKPYSYLVDEVTFTFVLTNDYFARKYFDSWQQLIVDQQSLKMNYKNDYVTDVTIQQLTSSNDIIPAYTVKLKNAFPLAVNAIELSNSSENSLLQCSVTLSFDDWEEVGLLDGFTDLVSKGRDIFDATVGQVKGLF
jgi:hypothetical protein